MSNFHSIQKDHQQLYNALTEGSEPAPETVRTLIHKAVEGAKRITYIEDRHELGYILRFWGSYLTLHDPEGALPDMDIGHPERRPTRVESRRKQSHQKLLLKLS